jgi:hypothetical protein
MKAVISTLLISLILLAATPANADTIITDAKTLFFVIFRLEQNIPFRKKEIKRLLISDYKLHRHRALDGSLGHSKNYSTRVQHKGALSQLTLQQSSNPTESSFKGLVTIKLNEIAEEATIDDVRATFGDPDRESDSMVANASPDAQPYALIYDRSWGTLTFNISRTIDHRVLEVTMQAGTPEL